MNTVFSAHRWTIAEQDRPKMKVLAEALDLPPLMAHLLLLRGIETPEQARLFLRPSLDQLSDPMALSGVEQAAARLAQARKRGERVLVFGDYDVDGVAGVAIFVNGLRRFGLSNLEYGMPLRLSEGYGIGPDHVDAAHANGVSLILTVDNGINAHGAARRARELGIDLIVTDHHAIDEGLPEAVAVINPKREAPDHPAYHLCGAGVAFKLCTALNGTPNDLDIAAIGTVADIVPLRGENRVIVALGLRHMIKYQRNGLAKLARQAGFDLPEVSSGKIGFQLGPRINAAGRLDDALTALKLLLSECPEEAGQMARELHEANEERRNIEKDIFEEAKAELDACFSAEQRSIVLARRGWHAGVIGIVASRIETHYHRPSVVIAVDEDGIGRGSARSGPGANLAEALSACGGLLEKYGGHRAAAGMTILESNVPAFVEAFEAEILRQLGPGEIVPELAIDAVAAFSQINPALLHSLEQLEPLGHHNRAPVFCSMGVEVVARSVQIVKDRHLKLLVRQEGTVFPAIGFGMGERIVPEELQGRIDIAYTPQFNTWRGQTSIQLHLKDIRR